MRKIRGGGGGEGGHPGVGSIYRRAPAAAVLRLRCITKIAGFHLRRNPDEYIVKINRSAPYCALPVLALLL